MIYEFDFYNRYEKPDLILCDSYDEEIGVIPQYEDLGITINLDEVSDLSYKIYAVDYDTRYPEFKSSRAYVSGDIVMHERVLYKRIADSTAPGEWNEAEWTVFTPNSTADTVNDPAVADIYKMHAERRQVHAAGIGYFIITEVNENVDDKGIYKEISAKSCEYELTNITAPYVEGTYQLYTTESYAQLDNYDRFKYLSDMAESENVADDDMGMYHSDNCLLFELLCYAPSWRLSPRTLEKLTTDPKYESIATAHRTYDDADRTLYSFFKDIISDSYECFITFDCEHRYIEIYTYDDALTEIGVVLSEANILDSCEVQTTIDDYVNCLKVKGGTDDINISTFNPLGNRLIYNFSHDMATGIISGELKQALEYWQDKINSDDFNKVEVTWGADAQAQIPYEVFEFGDGDDASPLYNFVYTVSRSFREWMTAYNNAMATNTYFDTPAPKMTLLASGLSHSYELEIHNALDAADMMTVWSGDETNPSGGNGYAEMTYTPASGQASAEQQAAAVYNKLQSSALSPLYSFNYTTGENTIRLTPKHDNDTYLYLPTTADSTLGAYFVIDGYHFKATSRIELDVQIISNIIQEVLFVAGSGNSQFQMYTNNSNCWSYNRYNSGYVWMKYPNTSTNIPVQLARQTYVYDSLNNQIRVNGATVSMKGSGSNEANSNLYLFGSSANHYGNVRVYGVKIYDNNVLQYNLVPAYNHNTSKVGLLDTVHNTFFANANTETNALQPVIKDDFNPPAVKITSVDNRNVVGSAFISALSPDPQLFQIMLGADYNYNELNNYMHTQPIAYVYGFDENGKVTYEDKQAITWKTTYDTAVLRSIPDIKKARLYLETETDIIDSEIYYIDAFIKGLTAQRSAVQSQLLTSAEVSDDNLDEETRAARGDLIARQVEAMTNTLAAFEDQKNVLLIISKEIESWANALKNIIEENINYNGFQEIFKEFAATPVANGGLGLSNTSGVNGEMSDAELKAMKLYNKLSRLIKQQTYTGENFIITDTDTMNEKFAQERALYNKGVEMLAKLSQPSAEVKVDAEPFMFNTDYHDVTQDIKMGTAIYIEMPSGEVPLYHLNQVSIDYDEPSCELTFGNRIRSNNPADIFADIQNVAASTADIVASNRIDWGVNTQRVNQLMLEKDADINTTARAMSNSINNVSLSSEGLKCFAKDPLTGEDTFGIWGANGCIMFQEPDGQGGYTNKAAIGRIIHTDGSVSYGFYGDRILANTITAEKLAVGTITHGGSNYLKNGSFEGLNVDEDTKTYIPLTVGTRPSDWNTNYSSYYTKSGNSYIRNTSSTWGRTTQYYKDDSFYIIEWYEGDSGTNALGYGFTGKIAQNGSRCLKLNNTSAYQKVTGLTAGTYTLSYYYKRNTQGNLQISIKEIISSNNERTLSTKSYDKATSNDTGWTKDYLQITVNDNASIKVVIAATGATGDTFVDSVMLDKSNYVGEYSPHSSEEYAAYTAIDGNGVRIYSGKLQMYDSSGALVFNADQSGNLWLKGMVEATSGKLGSWTLDANTIHSDEYKTGISLQNKTTSGSTTRESAAFWAGYSRQNPNVARTAPPNYEIDAQSGAPKLTQLPRFTNFMVTQNGTLYAKGAYISGRITLTNDNDKGSILDYLFDSDYQNGNDAHTVLTNSNLWNNNPNSDGLITVSQAGSLYMSSNTQVNGLGGTITSSQMGNMGGFNWSTTNATNSTTVPAPTIQNGGYYLYLSGAPQTGEDAVILAGIKNANGQPLTGSSYKSLPIGTQPSDWNTNYLSYYTKSGNSYVKNTSSTWGRTTQYYALTDDTYFRVKANGTLEARNANIKGQITADSIVTNHLTVLKDGTGSESFSLNLAAGEGSNAGHIIYNNSGMSVQFGNQANGNCIKYSSTGGTAVYLGGFTYKSGYTALSGYPHNWDANYGKYYIYDGTTYVLNTSRDYDPSETYYQYNDTNMGGWKIGEYTLFNDNAGSRDSTDFLIHAGPNFNVSNTGILRTVSAELSGTLTTKAEGTATVIQGASINLVNQNDNTYFGPAISLATQNTSGGSKDFSLWSIITGGISDANLSQCELGLYSPNQIIFGKRKGVNGADSTAPAFVMDYSSSAENWVFRGARTNKMDLGSTQFPWRRIFLPTAGGTTGTALETNGSALSISFGEILGDTISSAFSFDLSLAFKLANLNRLKFDGRDVMTAADTVLISFIIAQYVKRVVLYPLNIGIV